MQRSVRENIALPFSARLARVGSARHRGRRSSRVDDAIGRLQIDTRAQREVQRLSGGNQQKVTIARWIATGARTVLCFDPTRGIDIRTKREIYPLLRELAAQGASVLFYTSELEEVQRVCDRAVVIFGGRVVDVLPVEIADEAVLMRAAYGLPRESAGTWHRRRGSGLAPVSARGMNRFVRRHGWVVGLFVLFAPAPRRHAAHPARLRRRPTSDRSPGPLSLSRFAVAAQTVVVIAGGVDLSIAAMMALTSVTAATHDGRRRRRICDRRRAPRARSSGSCSAPSTAP